MGGIRGGLRKLLEAFWRACAFLSLRGLPAFPITNSPAVDVGVGGSWQVRNGRTKAN